MKSKLNKAWNVLSTIIVVFFVLCAIFLMGSRILGYRVFTVISGSMEPTYSVGDLLYVKASNFNEIAIGDPITFVMNEDLVVATHRVVKIDTEKQRFYTKGDANEIEDSNPVPYQNVLGVPQFSIPKLGYVSNFIQNPPGVYITIALGVILILIVFLPDFKKKKTEEEESTNVSGDVASAAEENEKLKAELERLKAEMAAMKPEDSE